MLLNLNKHKLNEHLDVPQIIYSKLFAVLAAFIDCVMISWCIC